MTLKRFIICNLPHGADFGVVPGGKITKENMKTKQGEFDISSERFLGE